MKKVFICGVLICFTGYISNAAKIKVKGSGGMTTDGNKTTYCPNESRKTCAVIKGNAEYFSVGDYVEMFDEADNPIGEGIISFFPGTSIDENNEEVVNHGLELTNEE